ncbi:MAG: HEAT repeat domain-containing protein [Planctomycetes bacterium]|nr:HEAT repeat domain-containing protein [Planctomycetota bacterium]
MTNKAQTSLLTCTLSMLLAAGPAVAADAPLLKLEKGDRICVIGSTLAERMQHDGWLEALLHARFPEHELVVRNLAFSGDEVAERLRSEGFGSPDEHLKRHGADVVFAFFGFNESFDGEARLERFRKDLDDFLKRTLGQSYGGKGPPRVVLFSPIGCEDLKSPDLPDGAETNRRLRLYAGVLGEAAKAHGVPFVDLLAPSLRLYGEAKRPLTMNGIHLRDEGDRLIAAVIDEALFGKREKPVDWAGLEKLRGAVVEKGFFWFHRYRTTDGYNVFGGRSGLKYTDGISNRDVLEREMEVLDVLTANRDRRIWALARGGDAPVDDGNTPSFIAVKTNHPGKGAEGAHVFLGGEEAIGHMKVPEGMKVSLVATEETFPELANPVQMAFDARGRLWVAAWPSYPHWKPKEPMDDKLLILEDSDGDGRAERCKVFAGGLHNPTGFELYGGGVLVAMAPDLLFLKDTDGDDRADVRERVLHGLGSEDTHHTANSFVLDPGGALYFQEGVFHRTQVETPYGPLRNRDACVWRFEPRTWRLERHVPYGFANPHGHVFDRWGQNFVYDGTGAEPFHAALFSGHLEYPDKHPRPPKLYEQRTRPCPGVEVLSSRSFPEESQGNLLVGNVIGFLGILQYKVEPKGASFYAKEVEPLLKSADPNFRPSDLEVGPDGAVWLLDWQNPIIGHMQHHIRDPNRDHAHGRVYRITCSARPALRPSKIAGEPIERLLDVLVEPEDRARYRARIELSGRDAKEVAAAAARWVDGLDKGDSAYEHHVLEGLWVHQLANVVNEGLLRRVLRSPEPRARAAATRVLCAWRERVEDPLGLLLERAKDEHPLVRLEAVRASSFFRSPKAAEVALESVNLPQDEYLKFVLDQTMKALDRYQ